MCPVLWFMLFSFYANLIRFVDPLYYTSGMSLFLKWTRKNVETRGKSYTHKLLNVIL